ACVCASCRCNVEGERVELSVEDGGPGIPPDVQERRSEPCFTTNPVGQGSGMGLATVHGIVHEHGGHIVVDSGPGTGTTFRVLLAAQAAQVDLVSPTRAYLDFPPAARSLAGRVAVIDAELPVARFMEDRLAHW